MLLGKFRWLALTVSLLSVIAQAQEAQLEPGRAIEREIAGGQSHTYHISLAAGQFVRFRLEQRALDAVLILTALDGKQLVEMDMTGAGESESLSLEVASSGNYQLIVRGNGTQVLRGSYRLEAAVQAMATVEDRKRLTAEGLLIEASALSNQEADTAQQVIEKSQQALTLWRELGEPSLIATALNLIGDVYDATDQYEKAIEYYQQVLDICREHRLRQREGIMLRSLSVTYTRLNQDEQAIAVCEQALAIAREVNDRVGEVYALNNLSAYYGTIARNDKKIEYLEQALALNRLVKDRKSQHQSLHNLGAAFHRQGEYEKAIFHYEQALAIARELKNRWREEATLSSMGESYAGLKQYEKAITLYEQALAISLAIKDRSNESNNLWVLGVAYTSLRQYEKAIASLEQALAISREIGSLFYQFHILADLARTENERGNLAQARIYIEESLRIAEVLRARNESFVNRATFFTSVQSAYQLYTDVLMRQHKAEPAKGFDALAVETSERQRARSLLDVLSEARTDLHKGVDPALLERELSLGRQLNVRAQRLTQSSNPAEVAALKQEISQLETDYERAQVAIRKANPHYALLTRAQPLKFKEIQAQLDADTLLLEYSLGEERSYLWAISRETLTSYELPKGAQIQQNAFTVYERMTARSTSKPGESALQRQERIALAETNLPAAAQALSQTLLAPVAPQLGNKRLVIIADGALQYIPFAMLPDPQNNGLAERDSRGMTNPQSAIRNSQSSAPLILNHEIISLPSASALAIQRAELAGRQPAPKLLAVIADPVFDRSDARFTIPLTATNDQMPARARSVEDERRIEHLAEKSADPAGGTIRRLRIPRLPFTRQEATRLLALTPKNSSFSAIDFQANREMVLNGSLSQYRYVHFATHGLLDSERPGLSSLVLSMVDAQGRPQDGFLRANDIYNLKLPAELVVLSACQTGLGKEIKGEGLVGLTRGFMYAGASRVVVSLWSVNDKATAELMTRFYEKMLKQGERPAAALRAAQVEMWKQKAWESPYYWAAFIMQGEWK